MRELKSGRRKENHSTRHAATRHQNKYRGAGRDARIISRNQLDAKFAYRSFVEREKFNGGASALSDGVMA